MKTLTPQQVVHYHLPKAAKCLSLYANSFSDLKEKLEQSLAQARKEKLITETEHLHRPVRRLLSKIEAKQDNFPIAVFVTHGFSCQIKLPFEVKKLAVVASSFHVKPLLKWMQREHPFSMLLLEDSQAVLFQGTLSALEEKEVLPYNELRGMDGVFNALDRAVYRTIQSTRTPLILAGDTDLADQYKNVSGYRAIVEESIPHSPGLEPRKALHESAIALLEPYLASREDALLAQYRSAELNGRTAGSLQEIIQFSLNRKVKHLFISEGLNIWGNIDSENGTFTYSPHQLNSSEDDVLDDLAEIVIRNGGAVTVLPSEKMPNGSVACAILQGVDSASRFQRKTLLATNYDEKPLAG